MREPVLIREEKQMDWKKKKKTNDEQEDELEVELEAETGVAIVASPPSSDVITWQKYGMVLRVLLVEADDSTRHVISALLRKCSYRVAAVADGLMAWETLKGKPGYIDLVLTEVDLPSISGYALLTLVTEHDACKNIPVVMMSSHDSLNTVLKCVLKGAADFLLKPIRKNELRNLWQHVLRRQSGTDGVLRTPPAIKLEATSENHVPSNQSSIGTSSSSSQREKNNDVETNDAGFLEICMKSHNVLNHSNASAFSWYSNKVAVPVPLSVPEIRKLETGTNSVSGNMDNSEAVDEELHGSVITEKSSDVQCPSQPEMTRREAALMKFRQKRKDRCFEKKVRYHSRKKLAEQRPRVKGQFVRHVAGCEDS